MKKCIIVHGWGGTAGMGWHGWLKTELESRGWEVICPQMPGKDMPNIFLWTEKLRETVGVPDENTYLVGHSIGCQTIIRYLETIDQKIGGVVFVAPFITHIDNLLDSERAQKYKDIVKGIDDDWAETPIDVAKVNSVINKNVAIFSDNDSRVKIENKEIFEKKFNSKTILLHNMNHFSPITDNCLELPEALDEILKLAE